MPATLSVYDESTAGDRGAPIVLRFPSEEITVRELIRERVYQEVQDHNLRQADPSRLGDGTFRGLVQPKNAEPALDGYRMREPREVDWREQYELALEAFEARRVIVLVNKRQADALDERVMVAPSTDVAFLKLVPLVGG
ncbi:MAG: hypothetical protein AAFU73_19265 [Planctomycetota bacterium]